MLGLQLRNQKIKKISTACRSFKLAVTSVQWGGGGRALTGKFLLAHQEKRGKEKKGTWRRKEGKLKKGRLKIENRRDESYKIRRGPLFFFFFFFFSLFKTTEICFGSTRMGIFYQEKSFHAGKKSGNMTLPPMKNIPLTPLRQCNFRGGCGCFAGMRLHASLMEHAVNCPLTCITANFKMYRLYVGTYLEELLSQTSIYHMIS